MLGVFVGRALDFGLLIGLLVGRVLSAVFLAFFSLGVAFATFVGSRGLAFLLLLLNSFSAGFELQKRF